ncbi:P1 family peptidase [Bacillus sp. JCM 19041]|uniref:P1 family peptidase n=1 Tax=Bacillus sp. JCM 19041 TaxID=1460637 RepID=UPI0006CF45C3
MLATDASLGARQLKRLAKRGALGLGRTASYAANGSGDIVIAFSTAQRVPHQGGSPTHSFHFLLDSDNQMDHLFAASAEAVEEAILNALCTASAMTGRDGHFRPALRDNLFP